MFNMFIQHVTVPRVIGKGSFCLRSEPSHTERNWKKISDWENLV